MCLRARRQARSRDDPVLFFIDPFGMEGADLRLIDRILDRKSKTVTELLINFSYRGFQAG